MSQQNGYIGRSPGDSAVIIASQTFEPTGIQTDFTFAAGYTVGYLDVYFNGARLISANDYTAANGTTVGLTTYAHDGDIIECVAYKAFNVGDVTEARNNFTVSNKLTVSGVTTATSAYYTGIVTATSFSGDGSSLTGVANTDVINTENINVIGVATVGSAVTINSTGIDAVSGVITAANFVGGGANLTALSGTNIASGTVAAARVATLNQNTTGTSAGLTGTPDITVGNISASGGDLTIRNITGVAATFTGVLTYEDVTNVDSVGIVTARGGLEVGAAGVGGTISSGGNVIFAGITTVGTALSLADNVRAKFGNSGDLAISHDGSHSYVQDSGTGNLYLRTNGAGVVIDDGSATFARFLNGNACDFNFNGSKKFETTSTGVSIAGTTISSGGDFITYDNGHVKLGQNSDLDLFHNGTHSYIRSAVGDLNINAGNSAQNICINLNENVAGVTSEKAARFIKNGAAELYHDNYKKIETLSTGVKVTGITSTTSLTVGPGVIQEKLYTVASALTGTVNFDVVTNGLVQYHTTNSSATWVVNLRGDGSTTLNSLLHIGQTTVFTLYSAQNNASYYMTDFQIDGSSQTEKWNGGSAPSAGTASGVDVYTFNIMKTADATFTVFANFSNFA